MRKQKTAFWAFFLIVFSLPKASHVPSNMAAKLESMKVDWEPLIDGRKKKFLPPVNPL